MYRKYLGGVEGFNKLSGQLHCFEINLNIQLKIVEQNIKNINFLLCFFKY